MNIYKIIKRSLTTEKGTMIASDNKYILEVERGANKIEIKILQRTQRIQ